MTQFQNPALAQAVQNTFLDLPDPRADNIIHPLINIVTIALVAVLSGADDFEEITEFGITRETWFKTFLDLREGIPSQDTFLRVLSILDPTQFTHCILNWVRFHIQGSLGQDFIALDGKRLKGASHTEENAFYLVNAWASKHGLALANIPVTAKSNEITALPPLIETISLLDLEGCIVTTDAMGTQREVARVLTEQKALYVLALKDNQLSLAEDVRWLFRVAQENNFKNVNFDYHKTQDQSHGRIEERQCWVLTDLEFLQASGWKGLNAIVLVESKRVVKGIGTVEQRFFLSSVGGDAKLDKKRCGRIGGWRIGCIGCWMLFFGKMHINYGRGWRCVI